MSSIILLWYQYCTCYGYILYIPPAYSTTTSCFQVFEHVCDRPPTAKHFTKDGGKTRYTEHGTDKNNYSIIANRVPWLIHRQQSSIRPPKTHSIWILFNWILLNLNYTSFNISNKNSWSWRRINKSNQDIRLSKSLLKTTNLIGWQSHRRVINYQPCRDQGRLLQDLQKHRHLQCQLPRQHHQIIPILMTAKQTKAAVCLRINTIPASRCLHPNTTLVHGALDNTQVRALQREERLRSSNMSNQG